MADIIDIKAEREKLQAQIKALEERNAVTDLMGDIPNIHSEFADRGEAEKDNEELKLMNTKYAFILSLGTKPAIMTKIYNEYYEKEIIEFIAPESLVLRYLNVVAEETRGNKSGGITRGKWWIGHPHRKDYDTVTFEPEKAPGEYHVRNKQNEINSYYNMWEGFGVEPKRGQWKKVLRHIYTILSNSDSIKFKYTMRWFAWAIQNPGKQAEVALIFKGKKGAGKGFLLQQFVKIFGRHGMTIANREHLVGKHNDHLAYTSFLLSDEAYHPGDKEVEGILKNLITESSLTIEPKFRGLKTCKNCLHIVMSTNADWVIPATEDERRYFINEVTNIYAKGQCEDNVREKYFRDMSAEVKQGGLEAMLYDLKNMQLGEWHPRNAVPRTEELMKQIAMSLPKLKYAFMTMLEDGTFPGTTNGSLNYVISNKNLTEYLQNLDVGNKNISSKAVSRLCQELSIVSSRDRYSRFYIFPELGYLRDKWNKTIGDNPNWSISERWYVAGKPTEKLQQTESEDEPIF